MIPLLRLVNVSKQRQNRLGETVAVLVDVSFDLSLGQTCALIGPSGSGKSTLLRLINRLENVDSGTIEFADAPLAAYNPLELRRRAGLVLQRPFMFPGSVRDNLNYPCTVRGLSGPEESDLLSLLQTCAVDPIWLDEPAARLSIGQQQRVNIARTLTCRPQLLMLDEPTSALDPETADLVMQGLATLARDTGMGLLFVTHDHLLARRYADRIMSLSGGRIEESGGGA